MARRSRGGKRTPALPGPPPPRPPNEEAEGASEAVAPTPPPTPPPPPTDVPVQLILWIFAGIGGVVGLASGLAHWAVYDANGLIANPQTVYAAIAGLVGGLACGAATGRALFLSPRFQLPLVGIMVWLGYFLYNHAVSVAPIMAGGVGLVLSLLAERLDQHGGED